MSHFKKLRDLLADPARWTKKHLAKDEHGVYTYPMEDRAVCWCVFGGLIKVMGPDASDQAVYEAAQSVGKCFPMELAYPIEENYGASLRPIGLINDDPRTTHDIVLAAIDKAIEQEQQS
jgi:hypothetical protein